VGISASGASASPPTITFTAGPTGVVDTQSATFTFTINRKPKAIKQLSCALDAVSGPCGAISPSGTRNSASGVSYSSLAAGGHKLVVTATLTDGGIASASRSWTVSPPKTLLDVSDPTGDDHGSGTYQYPTDTSFVPGSFDLTDFQVIDDAANVVFRVQTGALTPSVQLFDIYVHNPTAVTTSMGAAFASRNYAIAPAAAWSQRIEIRASAAPVFVDALGNSLGAPSVSTDSTSRETTITVPKSAFGQPGSGWAFTVVLTGQDGSSPDLARGFAATSQPFLFGVCSPGGNSSICSVDPATVPKAIDVLTPPGVSQATEMDPTLGPVTLQGVRIP
jgi:hypothetical protein